MLWWHSAASKIHSENFDIHSDIYSISNTSLNIYWSLRRQKEASVSARKTNNRSASAILGLIKTYKDIEPLQGFCEINARNKLTYIHWWTYSLISCVIPSILPTAQETSLNWASQCARYAHHLLAPSTSVKLGVEFSDAIPIAGPIFAINLVSSSPLQTMELHSSNNRAKFGLRNVLLVTINRMLHSLT